MTLLVRVPATLNIRLAPDPVWCSVLWLIPERPGELAETMRDLARGLSPLGCRAVLCRPAAAQPPRMLAGIAGVGVVGEATIDIQGDASICEIADVDVAQSAGFWSLFEKSPYGRQLCGALFRGEGVSPGDLEKAAIQLGVIAGTGSLRRLASAIEVQETLLDAFIAETVAAGGVAVTRVVPELLRSGIGLTGPDDKIDEVEAQLAHLPRADETATRHSIQLGGPWPR